MNTVQEGILQAVPRQARYLMFILKPAHNAATVLSRFAESIDGEKTVVGLGFSLLQYLNG